jgi:hypothetical protein
MKRGDATLSSRTMNFRGPRGAGDRRMIEVSAAGRAGTPDEGDKAISFLSY